MRKHKLLIIAASFCAILGTQSCAHMDAENAHAAATAEINKAKSMGNEWRDSGKILKKAQKALDDGDVEMAEKLIAKAKKQGMDAQMQAKQQMNVTGPH